MYSRTMPGERGRVTDIYATEEQIVLGGGDYIMAPGARLKVGPHGGMYESMGMVITSPGGRLKVGPDGGLYETLGADRKRKKRRKKTKAIDFLSAKDRKLWKKAKAMEMRARANPMLKRSKKYKKLHWHYVRLKRALASYQRKLDEARARLPKGRGRTVKFARPKYGARRPRRPRPQPQPEPSDTGIPGPGMSTGQSTDPCAPYYTGTAQCEVPPDVPTEPEVPEDQPPLPDEEKLPGEPVPQPETGGGGLLPPSPGRPYDPGPYPGRPPAPSDPKVGRPPDMIVSPMPGMPGRRIPTSLIIGGAAAGALVLFMMLRKRS